MFGWLRRAGRAKSAPTPSVPLVPAPRIASDPDAPAVPAGASDPRVLAGVYTRRFAGMAADKDTLIRVLADPPAWSNTITLAGPPARAATPSPSPSPSPGDAMTQALRSAPAAQPVHPTLPAGVMRHAEPVSAPDSSYIASRVLGPRLAHGGPPWDTTLPR
jgi:hypothetical protein